MKNKNNHFELIFEGLNDSSTQSLQRIKGILIGDLELTIPEVQNALENCPLPIKRAENRKDLLVYFESLKEAGAKVLILQPREEQAAEAPRPVSNEIEFNLDGIDPSLSVKKQDAQTAESAAEEPAEPEAEPEEIEFEVSFEDTHKEPPVPRKPRTYEINLEDEESVSLDDLKKEWESETHGAEESALAVLSPDTPSDTPRLKAEGGTPEVSSQKDDFSLDLQAPAEVMQLIDNDAAAPADLDEDGEWGLNTLSSALAEAGNPEDNAALFDLKITSEETPAAPEEVKPAVEEPGRFTDSSPLFEIEGGPILHPAPPEPQAVKPAANEKPVVTMAHAAKKKETEQVTVSFVVENKAQGAAIEDQTQGDEEIPLPETGPAVKTKKRRRSSLPTDILLPVVIGGLLLGVINWLYFSNQDKGDSINIAAALKEKPKPKAKKDVPPPVPEAPAFDYAAEANYPDRTVTAKLNTNLEKIHSVSIEGTSSAPQPLTPEEVVNNVEPRPWIRKFEIDGLTLEKDAAGGFIARGPAKIYIDQGGKRRRIVANSVLTIFKDSQGDTLNTGLEISLNYSPENDPASELFIAKNPDGSYSMFFSAALKFDKTAPPALPGDEASGHPPAEEKSASG